MKNILFTTDITQENITKGVPKNATQCPIALALKEEYHWATVAPNNIAFGETPLENNRYECSQRLRDYILNFDEGLDIRPITIAFYEDENQIDTCVDIYKEQTNG